MYHVRPTASFSEYGGVTTRRRRYLVEATYNFKRRPVTSSKAEDDCLGDQNSSRWTDCLVPPTKQQRDATHTKGLVVSIEKIRGSTPIDDSTACVNYEWILHRKERWEITPNNDKEMVM